ncbi:MAG: hypothetical protein OET79_12495, partial [Nitrospirota bacterium]|nr:hypothetical protein [Nitrospirota bacterium]
MMAAVIETDQAEIVAFLCRGTSFGLSGAPVERIETHAASIFLIGARAYKMKRAVRYSFLDFSTLARRQAVLEAELRLNRRTAPRLYRRVLPITRGANGELVLDGPGEPIEWLLEMERFDQAALLDHLADRGDLTARLIDQLAQEIIDFHATAEIRRDLGGHAGMAEVIEGNAKDLQILAGTILPPETVEAVNRASLAELNRCR